jgi:hypothetical protein
MTNYRPIGVIIRAHACDWKRYPVIVKRCHPHNFHRDDADAKPFGIRVTLPSGDSFSSLIGAGWAREHWYPTEHDRDVALDDMASEHLYSRRGDRPTLIFEPIERSAG